MTVPADEQRLREIVHRSLEATSDDLLALKRISDERDAAVREAAELQAWGQQVHDALDGRSLPEHPDEAPARIAAVVREAAGLRGELARKGRLLQMIVDDNFLLGRDDDWERLAVRHIVTARAALEATE